MNYINILPCKNRQEFRNWLQNNANSASECFILLKRGKPIGDNSFYYLDAVEEAICFGWIDSTLTKINGVSYQRFTSRKDRSHWTELNKERARRLIKLGLMNERGYCYIPDLSDISLHMEKCIEKMMKENGVLDTFLSFPLLYQRIRHDNLFFCYTKLPNSYPAAVSNFLKYTKQNKMYGPWSDYGRLLSY